MTIDPPSEPHHGATGSGGPASCDTARELLSARLDGEATNEERRRLSFHLDGCAACRTHADALDALSRRLRVRPAEDVPDLVASVTARVRPARLGRGGWLRPALAWVAVVMFVQSVPALVWGDLGGTDTHHARHLGAFGVALAIGFAYAAWRPHRAFGMLPFTAALVATMLVALIADVLGSGRSAVSEIVHVTELVGLVLLWMIAGSPGLPHRSLRRHGPLAGWRASIRSSAVSHQSNRFRAASPDTP